jgi:two-component system nitrate/nitrite response regulator NarL
MRMPSAELGWEVESSPAQSRQSADPPAAPTDQQIAGRAVSLLPNKAAARSRSRSSRPRRAVPVVVIDKSALFRAGLVYILSGSRFRVAASCSGLEDLSERIYSDKRCIVLISLDEQTRPLLSRVVSLAARGVRVVALSERFQPEEAFAAIEAGADGYLLKNEISPDALVKSLELVLLGGVVIPQGLSKLLHQARLDTPPVQYGNRYRGGSTTPSRARSTMSGIGCMTLSRRWSNGFGLTKSTARAKCTTLFGTRW